MEHIFSPVIILRAFRVWLSESLVSLNEGVLPLICLIPGRFLHWTYVLLSIQLAMQLFAIVLRHHTMVPNFDSATR